MAALHVRCCARAFSSCGTAGATLRCSAWASQYSGFSCCRAQAPGAQASVVVAHGLSGCGSRALESRLSSCGAWAQLLCGMWDLPGPGIEPVSPALTGRFLTTVPPRKSRDRYFETSEYPFPQQSVIHCFQHPLIILAQIKYYMKGYKMLTFQYYKSLFIHQLAFFYKEELYCSVPLPFFSITTDSFYSTCYIIHYYHGSLIYSSCPKFAQWELLKLASVSFRHISTNL